MFNTIDITTSATSRLAQEILTTSSKSSDFDKENHFYCYAIVRGDLEMPAGKLSAQSGHAYTDVLACASPERVKNYRQSDLGGSKVTLRAKNLHHLMRAYIELSAAGIPVAPVVDCEHVFPPHFDGSPVITALGVGPCKKSEVHHILKRFNTVK